MSMGSSGGSQQSSTTPWAAQQPYLEDVFAQAQKQYYAPGPYYYPGSTVAAPTADTLAAQDALRSAATGAQSTATKAEGALDFQLGAYDVNNNPYLQSAITAAINPLEHALTDVGGTIYGIGDEALAAGQYGGTRQGVAEGIATARFGEQAGNIAATMSNQAYQSGLEASGRALALAPQTQAMGAVPATYLDAVGQQQQQYQQALINDAVNRWNYEQNTPAQELSTYGGLVSGGFGGETTMEGGETSPVASAAGGAMSGYALGSMLGGAANGAAYGGWGAAIGAMIGLMGS